MGSPRTGPRMLTRARIAVRATFAAHAAVAGTMGPWIPTLKSRSALDAGGLGLALAAHAAGLVVGTRVATLAFARAGRSTVRLGVPVLAGCLALLPLAADLVSLAAIWAALGVVSGLLDVAMNIEAAAVERRAGRRLMSGMHGTWSAAMLGGAAVAAASLAGGVPVVIGLPVVAGAIAAASFPALRWLPTAADRSGAEPADARRPHRAAHIATVALLCLVPFASFLVEGVAAEWGAVYLREAIGAARGLAGAAVVAFSAGMAASRFAGDELATRHDPSFVVRVGASVGAIALGGAVLVGGAGPALVAFVVLGLGIGPSVPLAFSAAADVGTPHRRSVLGPAVTAGYLGSIVGPMAVGFAADRYGLRWAFAIPVAMCAVAALGGGALRERKQA
ncbi:MAG: MFS transporter [Candidatus Velamenicoccus archaeovorus]